MSAKPEPTDPRFPFGVPVNRKEWEDKPKPERVKVRDGVFSVAGKLQTDLPITGPRKAP